MKQVITLESKELKNDCREGFEHSRIERGAAEIQYSD